MVPERIHSATGTSRTRSPVTQPAPDAVTTRPVAFTSAAVPGTGPAVGSTRASSARTNRSAPTTPTSSSPAITGWVKVSVYSSVHR